MEHMLSAAVILAGVCAGVFVHLVKGQNTPKKVKIVVESDFDEDSRRENHKKAA